MAELVRAIREAMPGRHYISPPLSERVVEVYAQRARSTTLDPFETLTPLERQVLHLAAEGHTNGEIAARLSVSPLTMEVHRASLMRKLGLRTHVDLIRYAIRPGIMSLQD